MGSTYRGLGAESAHHVAAQLHEVVCSCRPLVKVRQVHQPALIDVPVAPLQGHAYRHRHKLARDRSREMDQSFRQTSAVGSKSTSTTATAKLGAEGLQAAMRQQTFGGPAFHKTE